MAIHILDGAMGSTLMSQTGCTSEVWTLNFTHPQVVADLLRTYAQAGSEYIHTNSFTINPFTVKNTPYGMVESLQRSIDVAKEAVAGTSAKVAYDIGPLPQLMEPYGDLSEEECYDIYRSILEVGVGQVDAFSFLTFFDLPMLTVCAKIAHELNVPFLACLTFGAGNHTIMGNSPQDMVTAIAPYQPLALGLNCSHEPSKLMDILFEFRHHTQLPLIFKPNAGSPDTQSSQVVYHTDATHFAQEMIPAFSVGEVYVGGCCGTTPQYIQALTEQVRVYQRENEPK